MMVDRSYEKGVLDERERIANWLETHHIDHDCSVLVHDANDYDEDYCEGLFEEYDEWKAGACMRRTLADIIRGKITVT